MSTSSAALTSPVAATVPVDLPEGTLKIVWPTMGSTGPGRLVGRLCGVSTGVGFFTLGKLLAVASIPLGLAAFAWLFLPFVARRYRLTTRRMLVLGGLSGQEKAAVGLDEFEAIDIQVLPGQAWLRCGDLLFRRQGREVLRLAGVSRPEVFRENCLKAQAALLGVRKVLKQQSQPAAP